jgi:phage-related tail fiber protein
VAAGDDVAAMADASQPLARHWLSRWRGGATVVEEGSKKVKKAKKAKKQKKEKAAAPAPAAAAAPAAPLASEPVLLQLAAASAAGSAHNVLEVPSAELARLGLATGARVRVRGKRRATTVCVVASVGKLRVGDASSSVARLSPQVKARSHLRRELPNRTIPFSIL